MAKRPIKLLGRWIVAAEFWSLPEEERTRLIQTSREFTEKWKNAGVRQLALWNSLGEVSGYRHYGIWEVDSLDIAWQMSTEWTNSEMRRYTRWEFYIGS